MRQHGVLYTSLTVAAPMTYDAKAKERASQTVQELQEDIAHTEARIMLAQERDEEEHRERGIRSALGDPRFTDADFEELCGLWMSSYYSGARVDAAAAAAHAPPQKPPQRLTDALQLAPTGGPVQHRQPIVAKWLTRICQSRDFMHGVAFGSSPAEVWLIPLIDCIVATPSLQ